MSDTRPLVSIGLPFLNPGRFLEEAVRSVFAQTCSDWELILVDDGSSDGSYRLLSIINDGRLKLLRDGVCKGLPTRLNEIARLASGEFLARMDADDISHPQRLERQLALLQEVSEIDVVSTGSYLLNTEGVPTGLRWGIQPSVQEVLMRGGYLHPSLTARRKWFLENPYSEAYPRAEDRELFARTVPTSRFAVLKDPLYFYRWDGNVRLKAWLTGYQSERRILSRYGPSLVGWGKATGLRLRSYAKEAVARGLGVLGREQLLARRAYESLSVGERKKALAALEQVRAVRVPGWDD